MPVRLVVPALQLLILLPFALGCGGQAKRPEIEVRSSPVGMYEGPIVVFRGTGVLRDEAEIAASTGLPKGMEVDGQIRIEVREDHTFRYDWTVERGTTKGSLQGTWTRWTSQVEAVRPAGSAARSGWWAFLAEGETKLPERRCAVFQCVGSRVGVKASTVGELEEMWWFPGVDFKSGTFNSGVLQAFPVKP